MSARLSASRRASTKPLEERKGRMVTCAMCGVEFWRPTAWLRQSKETFCSKRCNGKRRIQNPRFRPGRTWSVERRAKAAERMRGPKNWAWKGGVTVFKKRGNYSGVRYVRAPEWALTMARKDGYVMEHRLQMAVLAGYLLTRTEVVNHENHDPTDNRPENLNLWPDNRTHKLYEWGKGLEGTACRLVIPRASWTMPAWSGASPSPAAPSSPDVAA